MSKSYSKAPAEAQKRLASVMERYCPELNLNQVRVDLLSITDDDNDEDTDDPVPALTKGGYACLAVVKVLGPKERTMGRGDAEIVIDEAAYLKLPEASRDAVLHHELYHLELKLNKNGRVIVDENKRPKLGMRLHDQQFGWFDSIARIHGKASIEVRQATDLVLKHKQDYFEFSLKSETPLTLLREKATPKKK